VAGATLGGIPLLVTSNSSFKPEVGTRFTIIDNTGSNSISGTFAGLAEGGVINLGSQSYFITYQGGDGNNDVQLIAIGALDTGFGESGRAVTSESVDSTVHGSTVSVAVQADGGIVVAGTVGSGTSANFTVLRLDTNGRLDDSFNGSGRTTTDFNPLLSFE